MSKRVQMVNGIFGNLMWITEDKVEEYKAAGHKLAASTPAKEPEKTVSEEVKADIKENKKRKRK